jgi:hypothetical protein
MLSEEIRYILKEVLEEILIKFNKDLVSVVLFGSHARGNPRQRSDIDLIVVSNLPEGWRERSALELSIKRLGLKVGRAIQVILMEPKDVCYSMENIAPLMLEIYDAYLCLFDREGFFHGEIVRFSEDLERQGVRKLGAFKWEVPVYASS